jgi:hypothetical protein
MHSEPKIVEIEFAKVLARDRERVEIVFLQVPAKFAAALLVFAPEKTSREQDKRGDNRRDYIDGNVAAESFHDIATVATVCDRGNQ